MTARAWTIDELNREHPLPESWEWDINAAGLGRVAAVFQRTKGVVLVDLLDNLRVIGDQAPACVCMAVMLAHGGHASLSNMSAAAEQRDEARRGRADLSLLISRLAQGFRGHSMNGLDLGHLHDDAVRLVEKMAAMRVAISNAIEASDNDGGSASDAIQDMLDILRDAISDD